MKKSASKVKTHDLRDVGYMKGINKKVGKMRSMSSLERAAKIRYAKMGISGMFH